MNSEETERGLGDEPVSGLIGELPKVEAPTGFESRVLNAIASEGKNETLWARSPRLVIAGAATLCIVAVVALWLALGSPSGGDLAAANVSPRRSDAQNPGVRGPQGTEVRPVNNAAPGGTEAREVPPGPPAAVPGVPSEANSNDYRGGSEDKALSPADGPLRPKGIEPRQGNLGDPNGSNVPISVESIFDFLGIKTSCSASGCKVVSVASGSIGANSGVKVGDLIVKSDETVLNGNYEFKGQANVKRLTIVRGGRQVVVDLRF